MKHLRKKPKSDSPVDLDGRALKILSEKGFGEQVSYDLPFGKGFHSKRAIFTAQQMLDLANKEGFTNLFDEPFYNVEEMLYALESEDAGIYKKGENLQDVHKFIGNCTRCKLCESRTNIVQTMGPTAAPLMFVGEAPAEAEDSEGMPLVGRAGVILAAIIAAMGLRPAEVILANIVRCRPPSNRRPTDREAMTCSLFLMHEIALIRPKVIVALGRSATSVLLGSEISFSERIGTFEDLNGVQVISTYHPAQLVRDPSKKAILWTHMRQVMGRLA